MLTAFSCYIDTSFDISCKTLVFTAVIVSVQVLSRSCVYVCIVSINDGSAMTCLLDHFSNYRIVDFFICGLQITSHLARDYLVLLALLALRTCFDPRYWSFGG